ncbi:MAG TPA: hypothetical protein VKE74_03090 [Gemmataceae bacterium]|nr:hypothetical protein [Gemmataceae bacterium]
MYSIDGPTWYKNGSKLTEDQSRGEVLDGYPVLGKVEVTDPGQRQKVYSAIRGAVRNPPPGSKCFIPRHAIRAVKGDETVDMVICFQCHNYEHHRGGKEVSGPNPLISSDPEALLDKILSDAGVPLASKDPP